MRSLNQLLLSSVSLSRFSVTWGSDIVRSKELYVTIGQSVVRHSEILSSSHASPQPPASHMPCVPVWLFLKQPPGHWTSSPSP